MTRGQKLRDEWEQVLRDDKAIVGSDQHVLLLAATYGTRDGEKILVGEATLAEKTGLSVATVRRALATGREHQYLFRVHRGHHVHGRAPAASEYRLTLPPQPCTDERLSEALNRAPVSG